MTRTTRIRRSVAEAYVAGWLAQPKQRRVRPEVLRANSKVVQPSITCGLPRQHSHGEPREHPGRSPHVP